MLCLDGEELKPWYNFSSWGVVYPEGINSQEATWDSSMRLDATRLEYEQAINEEVGVWVDVERGYLVLYGHEAYVSVTKREVAPFNKNTRNAIRGMLITVPLADVKVNTPLDKYEVVQLF